MKLDHLTPELLLQCLHGLEKECLRVTLEGKLARTPHPKSWGSSLCHPHISTDFSEAQLEFITPPFQSEQALFRFLENLHRFAYRENPDELMWPFSAPCRIDGEIPIAKSGSSNLGRKREIYRMGLAHRYGREMQSLSGVHYNFSLSPELVKAIFPHRDLSEIYLGTTRNYLRYGWVNTLLFGSSPALDRSFFDEVPKELTLGGENTLIGPYATSLRMSPLGYKSKEQRCGRVGYNSLEEYISDLECKLNEVSPAFAKIPKGEQLNPYVLQMEGEHYTRIRPKPPFIQGVRPLEVLKRRGITYIEVRGMDLNPLSPLGIDIEQFRFFYVFLLFCTLQKSDPLTPEEERSLSENQERVALYGRKEGLTLCFDGTEKPLREWALRIVSDLKRVAAIMGPPYLKAVERQEKKILDLSLLPSAKIVEELRSTSFAELGLRMAKVYRERYLAKQVPEAFAKMETKQALLSLEKQEAMEIRDDFILEGYEDCEISTQALLREAFKRGVEVEPLDREANFFRLSKGGRIEDVLQATMTSKDSMIAYFAMENKGVSKVLLSKAGIRVPQGAIFYSEPKALENYPSLSHMRLVVKPNRANYGIKIRFVEPRDFAGYAEAVRAVFTHGQEIVVEEFIPGREFRFLAIGDKIAAICERIPANVVGDGIDSIRDLVRKKNGDPHRYKTEKYQLRIGKIERERLARAGLSPDSIPEKGRQVFLRENTNVSTGGDAIDFTDEIHPGYSAISLRAAAACEATFCGIDMILSDFTKPPTDQNYGIIEVNFNPALWIHRYPTYGQKRYVEKDTLDALGFYG